MTEPYLDAAVHLFALAVTLAGIALLVVVATWPERRAKAVASDWCGEGDAIANKAQEHRNA